MIGRGQFARATVSLLAAALLSARGARAQTLIAQHYGLETGLGNNTVGSVYQDSRGYLWFATAEGLSRYDGHAFVTFTRADGLPSDVVREVVEDRWGHLWVATFGGLARMVEGIALEKASDRFVRVATGVTSQPAALGSSADGTLWCLTDDDGLLRGAPDERGTVTFSRVTGGNRFVATSRRPLLHVDRRGRAWIPRDDGLALAGDRERLVAYPATPRTASALGSDDEGHLLIGLGDALYELADAGQPSWRRLPVRLPAGATILAIATDRRRMVWIGTSRGVFGWRRDAFTDAPLVGPAAEVSGLLVDRQMNVWATTYKSGVFKVTRDLIVTYRTDALLGVDPVQTVFEDGGGRVYGFTQSGAIVDIDGNAVRVVARGGAPFDTVYRRLHLDRRGRWWTLSDEGLFYGAGPRAQGSAAWRRAGTFRPSIVENPVGAALAEDAGGHLWIGAARSALYRVDLDALRPDPRPVAAPPFEGFGGHLAFDRAGGLWSADNAHLRRLRGDRLDVFDPQPGLPETRVRTLFVDARGWLWVGLRLCGVAVTKNPEADRPVFTNYTTAEGLRSNAVHAITADGYGRMYFVTGRGIDRLDPADGYVRHYGDLGGSTTAASWLMTSRAGHVWASTDSGLVRFDPDADRLPTPPSPVYFTRVEAGGEPVAIAARSVGDVSGVVLPASRNTVRLEFAAVGFTGADRYQYRLSGIDDDWSAPAATRVVDYPRLPAGRYRFEVRSLNDRDEASPAAVASFRVLAPFWRTWWFIALAGGAVAALGGGAYRQRLLRRRALERVRRQVAHDLHDEVGSGLAQIAVLSEVARRDAGGGADPTLADIAGVARGLRDSMTDIIWAVDPRRDTLADLVARMRQVAANLLEADGVDFTLQAPPHDAMRGIDVPPDRRRHLLLVFKEAVTNIARHAGATRVTAILIVEPRDVVLTIQDNGRGFAPGATHAGNGVGSMRQRAADLGGTIDIRSGPGGTRVELRARIRA